MSVAIQNERCVGSRAVVHPVRGPRGIAPLECPTFGLRAGYLLANPWKNYLLPAGWLRWLISHSASPLIAESFSRPGGWRSMEIIYRNEEPLDWFDRQALRDNPISMAARNRRRVVTAWLAELIRKYGEQGPVSVLGIGAGPGQHLQHALVDSGITSTQATIWLVDLDTDAFGYGCQLAASLGIARAVRFIQGDARAIRDVLPGEQMQIVKLVGIVEYLSDQEFSDLLRSLRGIMSPGAALVTHGLVDPHGCSQFLARIFGLRHQQRSARQMITLLQASGFQVMNCVIEPGLVYPLLTAMPSD